MPSCLKIWFIPVLILMCSCSNRSSYTNKGDCPIVFFDSVIGNTHVTLCDGCDTSPWCLKINDNQIDYDSLFDKYDLGRVNLPYCLGNGGNGNVLMYGCDHCFVIHGDSVQNCILTPVLAVDTINSRLLSDNRADSLEDSLVFIVYDIQDNSTSRFRIEGINDTLYYHSDFSSEFVDGDLHVKYHDMGGALIDSVIEMRSIVNNVPLKRDEFKY